jgi:hypothetical protein
MRYGGEHQNQPCLAGPQPWPLVTKEWAGLSIFCSGRWLMVLRHD